MSKKCFNCQKEIPIEDFNKHELECVSRFYENEMENLIPCEKCQKLIPFEEYSTHLNLCGFETPIFYIPIPNNFINPIENENDLENEGENENENEGENENENENEGENENIGSNENDINILDNVEELINNNNFLINILNNLNFPLPVQTDEYEENSLLDENRVNKGIKLEEISKNIGLKEEIDCPICFEKEDNIVELNCGHKICFECSQNWFEENTKCPICMKDFDE